MPTYLWAPPKVALVSRVTVQPLFLKSGIYPPADTATSVLHDICRCLTLIGPNLVVPGSDWIQFEDPTLDDFASGAGTSTSGVQMEIQPDWLRSLGSFDGAAAATLVREYMALQGGDGARIRLAVERFHRAMRRHSSGDAAVELAIALDALLGDGESELTWKVGLRSALLAGGTKAERRERRAIVAAIYALRSTVVHTGQVPTAQKTRGLGKLKIDDLAERGMIIAATVIRAAIARGALPDWFDEELGPESIIEAAGTVVEVLTAQVREGANRP